MAIRCTNPGQGLRPIEAPARAAKCLFASKNEDACWTFEIFRIRGMCTVEEEMIVRPDRAVCIHARHARRGAVYRASRAPLLNRNSRIVGQDEFFSCMQMFESGLLPLPCEREILAVSSTLIRSGPAVSLRGDHCRLSFTAFGRGLPGRSTLARLARVSLRGVSLVSIQ